MASKRNTITLVQETSTDVASSIAQKPSLRNTRQRALVLDAVCSFGGHPTSAEVYEQVKKEHPKISRATVYRNLDTLVDLDRIMRIEVPSGATRYDKTNNPHYHLKCRECGCVFDVQMPYLQDLEQQVKLPSDFKIEGHQIIFEGLCADCLKN